MEYSQEIDLMETTVQTITILLGLFMTGLALLGIIFKAIEKSQAKIAEELLAHNAENQEFMVEYKQAAKESNQLTQLSNRETQKTMQDLNIEVVKLTSSMVNNLEADRGRDRRAEKRDEILESLVAITSRHSYALDEHEKRLMDIERIDFVKDYK